MPAPRRKPLGKPAAIEALRRGNTRRAAAGAAGVNATTFYRWLDDATFRNEVEKAEAEAEQFYLDAVRSATPESWQAAAWWLERRKHEDFGRRDRVDMSIDLRKVAEEIAHADGLDADSLIAEAERIVSGK